MRSYEDSLQRLGLDHIDILYIHDVDAYTHGEEVWPKMHRAAMDGAYRALDELRRNGDIKAIGLGVNQSQPIADALGRGAVGLLPPRRPLYAPRTGTARDTLSGT